MFYRTLTRGHIPRRDEHGRVADIHCLRHSFASKLARHCVGLVQAQHLMGHSDPSLTARVYTHVDQHDLRGAIDSLDTKKNTVGTHVA